ncbi:MAG: FecR domain-containing protein [Bdellovibrio sp.]
MAAEVASEKASSGRAKTPQSKASPRGEVRPFSSSFEIRTSIATLGVRGTDFEMSHSPEATEVYVKEGRVEIWPNSQAESKMLVSAGQRVQVRKVGDQILKPQLMGQK